MDKENKGIRAEEGKHKKGQGEYKENKRRTGRSKVIQGEKNGKIRKTRGK